MQHNKNNKNNNNNFNNGQASRKVTEIMMRIATKIETKYYVNDTPDETQVSEEILEETCLKLLKKWGNEENVIAKGKGFVIKKITSSVTSVTKIIYEIVEE